MKKIFVIAVIFGILCFTLDGFAAEAKHPIDIFLTKQIQKDSSTIGMIEATVAANKLWDDELNKYYKMLMSKFDKDRKTALQNVQIDWIKFRDAEFKLTAAVYSKMEGTMWRVIAVSRNMEVTRKRALELISLYNNLYEER
jgi:uncharacterized protein YecT (DUF1311 family)